MARELKRLPQLLGDIRAVGHLLPIGRRLALGPRLLDRPDDHALLVDPHAVRHVDHAEKLIDAMRAID